MKSEDGVSKTLDLWQSASLAFLIRHTAKICSLLVCVFQFFLWQSIVAFIAFSKYWINIQIDNISIYIISSSSQNAFLLIVYCWRKTVKCRERALVVTFYDIAARSDGRENRIPRRECLQSWSWSFVD